MPLPPPYWRRVTGALAGRRQLRDWTLVLNAAGIYWQLCRFGSRQYLYVSPLQEQLAARAIAAYVSDNAPGPAPQPAWPLHGFSLFAPLYLMPVAWLYGIQHGQAPAWLPRDIAWQKLGSLDNIRLFLHQEWWRPITSLDLHAGLAHLAGNLFFGSIFLILLARIAGIGRAWLLACLGGILGNFFSAMVHAPGYASIGFSTALFATVGAAGGLLFWHSANRIFMPVAASLAFLALLGTEGVNTDYAAHLCGLGAGVLLGFLAGLAARRRWPAIPQWLAGLLALGLPALAWAAALRLPQGVCAL